MAVVMAACESSSYDSGDGHYSYMQAEMVDAYTTDKGVISRVVTDEGKALLKKWGIEGEYIGIGNCILGYKDEHPEMKKRKDNYVYYVR